AGFVLHARARWPWAFELAATARPGPTAAVQRPLAFAAAASACAVGAVHVAWALGVPIGGAGAAGTRRTITGSLIIGFDGAFMIAGALGVVMLVRGGGRRTPPWLPLALAWVGAGSLFAWGLWHMILVLPNTALVRERAAAMGLVNMLA